MEKTEFSPWWPKRFGCIPLKNSSHKFWLGKLANLNAAKSSELGIAPHKPLMLFSVMDLIDSGTLTDRWVPYSPELVTRFRDYWDHVVERRKNLPEITMPFNALGGDRDAVWERFDEQGNPSKSKLTTRLCQLDSGLFHCLLDPEFRNLVRRILIANYFTPAEQVSLSARFGLPVPNTAEMAEYRRDREAFKKNEKKGRDIRFRADVAAGYKYTCALTGYCLQSSFGYIVQACHIHQHARSGNDDPRNGLALTPDAHWTFDKGLWTVIPKGDDLIILVARDRFTEESVSQNLLALRHGTLLHFHSGSKLRPAIEHLEWHRKTHGLGFK